jgi:signal transduction histidine kinase
MKKIVCPLLMVLSFVSTGLSQSFNTDSLLNELPKAKEDTNKVNLLRSIGVSFAHRNPQKAIEYWKQGVELSKKLTYDMGLTRSYINISTGFSFMGKYDSQIVYNDTALRYAHKIKDQNRLALIYLNQADAYRNLQDYKKALLYCDTALTYADKTGNTDRLARINDIISEIYAGQDQFAISILYLNKALELYKKDENTQMIGQVYSDFADIYKQINKHDSAILFYKLAISIADSVQDLKNLSTYYSDLTDLYINQEKYKEAEATATKAVVYAREQENNLQLATAYNHLSNLYLRQGKYSQSVETGKQAYDFAVQEDNLLWQKESATILSDAYQHIKDYPNAYRFLSISKDLNDSILRQRYDEQIAGLQTNFEIRGKDKEIQLLNKDKELQQQKLSRQRVLIAGAVALMILLLAGIGLLINRHRLHQRMKELQLRNEIAADLHDEVGSSLSSIHMLSEMATANTVHDSPQKEILNKVSGYTKETMEKMGDIVWMIKPTSQEGLKERMHRFLHEMGNSRNIHCSFDADGLTQIKLDMHQRKGLYLVFKEAVNNAVKYSNAKNIAVSLNESDQKINMTISDDGIGFASDNRKNGNGIDNMKNRAEELGGQTKIESAPGKGTVVSMSVPV